MILMNFEDFVLDFVDFVDFVDSDVDFVSISSILFSILLNFDDFVVDFENFLRSSRRAALLYTHHLHASLINGIEYYLKFHTRILGDFGGFWDFENFVKFWKLLKQNLADAGALPHDAMNSRGKNFHFFDDLELAERGAHRPLTRLMIFTRPA